MPHDGLGLLLLHPMAGAPDEVAAAIVGEGLTAHPREVAGALAAPVARAGDEAGGHRDLPAALRAQIVVEPPRWCGSDTHCSAAWKPVRSNRA